MSNLNEYQTDKLLDCFLFSVSELELQILKYNLKFIKPSWYNKNLIFEFSVVDIVKHYNMQELKNPYKEYSSALVKLTQRRYSYTNNNTKYTEVLVTKTSISDNNENNKLKFYLNEYISYKIADLNGVLDKFDIGHIAKFNNKYTFMLYGYCKKYLDQQIKPKNERKISRTLLLIDIRENANLVNKYKQFSDLDKRVLKVAKNDINKNSDINVNYNVERVSKTPVALKITAEYKII